MSELYLVLRNRLEAVTDWVQLGSEVMRAARKEQGLSHESMARKIPVSAKTYERWEKRGAVPVQWVEKAAGALQLEIERVPLPAKIRLQEGVSAPELADLTGRLEAALSSLADEAERLAGI